MNQRLISIIIPSYNRKKFIVEAIESILRQSYKNVEIILVDDGSIDGTESCIKQKYALNEKVKFYRNQKNMGAGISRKRGYSKSNGAYIIFMDDDDYYTNDTFFEQAINILEEKSNISFVSSSSMIQYIDKNEIEPSIMNIKGEIARTEYLKFFQTKYMKSNSTFTTVFRKSSLESSDFQNVKMVNDSSIYLRALLSGDAYILECISGIYRIHSNNISFGLKVDFIIENLEEKKRIYEQIKRKHMLKDPEEWIKDQILLTTSFYVKNNNIDDENFNQLLKWCNDNLYENKATIIDTLCRYKEEREKV